MMAKKESIRLFEDKKVRTIWDDEQEKWYFSISDIVEVLTDSKDPKQYIKKKSFDDDRMEILSVGVLDNYFTCHQCVHLMSLYKFDDDKLKILRIMAGHIVDLENHHDILMRFDFESNKLKALYISGGCALNYGGFIIDKEAPV